MKQWRVAFLLSVLALGSAGAFPGRAGAEGEQPAVEIISPQAGLTLSADSVGVQVRVAAAPPAKIASVELSVDGFLHSTRAIAPPVPAGTCTLQWDTPQFANGEHTLAVKAKDTSGKEATVQLRLTLARPELGREALPLVVIERPRSGEKVLGLARVDVKAQHPTGIKYVMIFVDDLFSFMANRPPFSYAWDTRRVADGPHTLVARAQAGTDAEADSTPVQVTVDNASQVEPESKPGTIREATMADVRPALAPAVAPAPVSAEKVAVPRTAPQPAASVAPAGAVSPKEAGAIAQASIPPVTIAAVGSPARQAAPPAVRATVAGSRAEPASAGPVRAATHAALASGALSTPKLTAAAPAPRAVLVPAPAKKAASAPAPEPRVVEAKAAMAEPRPGVGVAVAQAPIAAVGAVGGAIRALPLATAVKPVRAIGFAPAVGRTTEVRPQAPEVRVPRAVPMPQPERQLRAVPAPRLLEPRAPVEKPAEGIRLYYNGVPMDTDVQPEVRAGIAAGPFRHIIEHSGGQVFWNSGSRTITANALAKDIMLTIGSRKAIVDSNVLMMDLATYLEKGRAMVPLRFFRDAFDFTVEYDAATGRICIQR